MPEVKHILDDLNEIIDKVQRQAFDLDELKKDLKDLYQSIVDIRV